jgi:hypothetical protein
VPEIISQQREDTITGLASLTGLIPVSVVTSMTVTVPIPTFETPPVGYTPPPPVTEVPPISLPWLTPPAGGGYGMGSLRGRREWYELLPLELPDIGMGYLGGKAHTARGYVSPEERPEIRREEKLHAANVRMKRGAIDADLVDPHGKKVAHLHDRVVLKKNTYVGNWNRREKKVYVDPRLKPKEQEGVALHESIEQHEAVHRHVPKYPAHLIAEHIEGGWDKSHGLGKGYQHHVESLFRANLEKAGHPIGINKTVENMLGGTKPRRKKGKR